jgi:putative flippase GtrA
MGLTPRSGSAPTPRRQREKRAYQFAMVGGTAAVVTVVGTVLAIIGVLSGSVPVIAAIVAAICAFMFQRTVGKR